MAIEEKLRHLILAHYKSVKAFADEVGMPYTTIDSMLKRGLMKASVANVLKICRCLGISADSLGDGELQPYEKSDIELTEAEQELIRKYRALDERGKMAVADTVAREYSYAQPFLEESPVAT